MDVAESLMIIVSVARPGWRPWPPTLATGRSGRLSKDFGS